MLTLEKTAVANEREESLERVTELTAKQQDIIKAAKARKEPRTESNAKVLAAMRKNRQDERILNEKATRLWNLKSLQHEIQKPCNVLC